MRKSSASGLVCLIGGATLLGAAVGSIGAGHAGTRAEPFPGWGEPTIDANMSVDQAKAIVGERTRPQTEWKVLQAALSPARSG